MERKDKYFVVFEGTGGPNGAPNGVRRWGEFESPEAFVEVWENQDSTDRIIEAGVSEEIAKQLCAVVPGRVHVLGALEKARKSGSEVDQVDLQLKFANIEYFFPGEVKRVIRQN